MVGKSIISAQRKLGSPLDYLVQIGFLATSDMRKVKIDTTDGDMMEIYAVKGMQPLGRLQREWK